MHTSYHNLHQHTYSRFPARSDGTGACWRQISCSVAARSGQLRITKAARSPCMGSVCAFYCVPLCFDQSRASPCDVRSCACCGQSLCYMLLTIQRQYKSAVATDHVPTNPNPSETSDKSARVLLPYSKLPPHLKAESEGTTTIQDGGRAYSQLGYARNVDRVPAC